MADIPYMQAPGYITKVIEKIKVAAVPPRFTQDFLTTKLDYGSSSARPIIPFFKAIGLIDANGTPTNEYNAIRNTARSGHVAAKLLKIGYAPLYEVNEYIHEVGRQELMGAIVQVTGWPLDNQRTTAAAASFEAIRSLASFEDEIVIADSTPNTVAGYTPPPHNIPLQGRQLSIGYNINLNLPETTNPQVFDAIFSSLKRNLLDE